MNQLSPEFVAAVEAKFGELSTKAASTDERAGAAFNAVQELTQEVIALKTMGVGGGGERAKPEEAAHRKAFASFLRTGREENLSDLEQKALNVTTSADGGYAVPELLDRNVQALLRDTGSLRSVANVVSIGGGDYRRLVNLRGTGAGWVGETSARPETSSPQFAEIVPNMGEVYANPAATQRMLDDAFFDIEMWMAGEIAEEFALLENPAFVTGDGTNKPRGFLAGTVNTSSDGARAFGHLQMIKTGVAGGFTATTSSTNPVDDLIAVQHALKPPYRANATWTMNTSTLERVRKFKDADGNYIWRPGAEQGAPSLLLGYPVLELPDMPDVATNTFPIAFGDFRAGYTIVDRFGTRILRDPYSNKPYVHFYATKRVGGALIDSNAIKLLATRT
jgi:HK97 family phage major capsid protein